MKEQNKKEPTEASAKSGMQIELPMLQLLLDAKEEIEALSSQVGLKIIRHFLEEEIALKCGPHGRQQAYRHGSQPGYVVYAGRKVRIDKPRVRSKEGGRGDIGELQSFSAERPNAESRCAQVDAPGVYP